MSRPAAQRTTALLLLAVMPALWPAAARGKLRSRYALANACFAVTSDAAPHPAGTPLFFKPTALGRYLISGTDGRLVSADGHGGVQRIAEPGPAAEWVARRAGRRLSLRSTASRALLAVEAGGLRTVASPGAASRLRFGRRRGCRPYSEAALNLRGRPFRPAGPNGTVRGFADGHFHPTADLRGGGQVISGSAYDRFGITVALGRDAEVHGPDGSLDATGNLLRDGSPAGTHDVHGWPDFTGWPTYDTNTHQQLYYRWLQRAYRAGLRLTVAQLIEDAQLCDIEPRKSHSCDETETIALEVARLRGLQDYVDAQSGGPGRGWFRLVYDPAQARRVIRRGKLAVVMGVEASNPFGCGLKAGVAQCDKADVNAGVQLYHRLGIRAMFITHWVDNAFGGAAQEGGAKGTFITSFQLQTGLPFMTGPCPEEGEGEGGECNTRGLTPLGSHLVTRLMDAHMLIEADHLGEFTRRDVFERVAPRGYPLVSSHTDTGGVWVDSQLNRLRGIGGYAAATVDDAPALIAKTARLGAHGFAGVGLGSDTGGFKTLPGPLEKPLDYPFYSYDGRLSISRQRTGKRVYDLGRDGMAHYGLLPDLLADVARRPGGHHALKLLFGGAEAYLRTWELAARR